MNLNESPNRWYALLCDPEAERRERVRDVIVTVGGDAQAVPDVSPWDLSLGGGCLPIALVASGGIFTPRDLALNWIARGKAAGFKVIAYEDGVQQWPLQAKCLPLIAGAICLLDSCSSGFQSELREILDQTFQSVTRAARELQELRVVMHQHGIIGESSSIADVFKTALQFSKLSDLPVLITGESGTGKELLARAIYRLDPKRKHGPLVAINCAAISGSLMESEFFGHRRGSFTGAERNRKGLIRTAEGGVLFLDEIGELDLAVQAKLLRVLQENRLIGLGEEREVPVDVRFIAATNRDLEQLVAERKFRADLFHRLRVLHIHVPCLRERAKDLLPLVQHFLEKHKASHAKAAIGISEDFLEALEQLDLSGNVRQLENIIRQSLVNHCTGNSLGLNDLPLDVMRRLTESLPNAASEANGPLPERQTLGLASTKAGMNVRLKQVIESEGWNLNRTLSECERQAVQAALQSSHGNQSRAARLLGVTARSVYNKIRKHHLQGHF